MINSIQSCAWAVYRSVARKHLASPLKSATLSERRLVNQLDEPNCDIELIEKFF
jgi:hypothetical protein